jgi:hypothetical protein
MSQVSYFSHSEIYMSGEMIACYHDAMTALSNYHDTIIALSYDYEVIMLSYDGVVMLS